MATSRSAFLAKVDGFGEALHQAGNADLVDHLGQLPCAAFSHQADEFCEAFDDRLGLVESILVSTAHYCQDTVFGTCLTTGNRSIDEAAALVLGRCIKFTGNFGRRCGVVDKNRAFFQSMKGTIIAGRDGAQIVVVSDAGKDEVATFSCFLRGLGEVAAIFGSPFLGLRSRAVIDRDVVPTLVFRYPAIGYPMTPRPINATFAMTTLPSHAKARYEPGL